MGTFMVDMEIGDMSGERYVPFSGIVGRKSTFTALPASLLASLGVTPTGTRAFEVSDGRTVELSYGFTRLRYDGRETVVAVVFVEDDADVLIGQTTLEVLALEADLGNERLKPTMLRA